MTYGELYSASNGWTARHVAQDFMLMYGRNRVASESDIATVAKWEEKEKEAK